MLTVNIDSIKSQKFVKKTDPNTEYTCMGLGMNPNGTVFAVGLVFDAPNNRTELRTELIRDVQFLGNLTQ